MISSVTYLLSIYFAENFIGEASRIVQLLQIHENTVYYRTHDSHFGFPKEYWNNYVKAQNNYGKVNAHFYTGEDNAFYICKRVKHSLIYVHAAEPKDAKQLRSPLFNCECFPSEKIK